MKVSVLFALFAIYVTETISIRVKTPSAKDWAKFQKTEKELDENVILFEKNLEGLKTTVDFGPIDTNAV